MLRYKRTNNLPDKNTIKTMDIVNIKYPIMRTFSLPILSASIPDGIPIKVEDKLIDCIYYWYHIFFNAH